MKKVFILVVASALTFGSAYAGNMRPDNMHPRVQNERVEIVQHNQYNYHDDHNPARRNSDYLGSRHETERRYAECHRRSRGYRR